MSLQRLLPAGAFATATLLLSACATMTPQECLVANWGDLGLRDGQEGRPLSLRDARVRDCAKANVAVDERAYLAAREQGLGRYCRIDNAAALGLAGGVYEDVCPPPVHADFRLRFGLGRAVFDARAELRRLDERVESLERALRATRYDEERQLKDVKDEEVRKRIRTEFDERRHRIRDELGDLDRRLRRARDELRSAEQVLSGVR